MTPKRLIDVSHTVEHGMVTYKGFPAPVICDWLSRESSRAKYASGTEFQIGKIEIKADGVSYLFFGHLNNVDDIVLDNFPISVA